MVWYLLNVLHLLPYGHSVGAFLHVVQLIEKSAGELVEESNQVRPCRQERDLQIVNGIINSIVNGNINDTSECMRTDSTALSTRAVICSRFILDPICTIQRTSE